MFGNCWMLLRGSDCGPAFSTFVLSVQDQTTCVPASSCGRNRRVPLWPQQCRGRLIRKKGDLLRLCEAAKSFSNWEAVALAFLSFRHCLPRSEAGATLAKGGERVTVLRGEIHEGGSAARAGALGARVVAIFGQTQGS